ncbi:MAG: hypothetical protein JO154_15250 [Chitinophaga sp.]|uniref:hypothetical protein n=1 Tax=Chitinophaga sp. TaxID=1869181 RepID=UPI0025C33227|nr:hypothetical protein [Chitinophaga sp.]MBV8253958.1 hypothetical protein [Chitinophaga sp.]
MNKLHSISDIATKWRILRGSLLDNWEIVNFLLFHLSELRPLIKKGSIKQFSLLDIDNKPGKFYKKYNSNLLLGVAARIEKKTLFKTILLDQVAQTEDFLQDLVYRVYKDYPERLASAANENSEDEKKYQKLLHLIIKSSDKNEIVERLIEEKIRGIFYGKPLDFFIKDKAKIGFDDYFKNNFQITLSKYGEIIARRNLYTHNSGRVDSKYLNEVKSSTFKLGEKAPLDLKYITDTTRLCVGISTLALKQVIENTYKGTLKGHNPNKIINDLKKDYDI